VTTIRGDRRFEHDGDMLVHGQLVINTSTEGELFAIYDSSSATGASLFSIDMDDGLRIASEVDVMDGVLHVSSSGVEALAMNISSDLDISGHAFIGGSLSIGSDFQYSSIDGTMRLSAGTASLLELRADSLSDSSAMIDIQSHSSSGYLFKAMNQG
jgi:hypothetical protein